MAERIALDLEFSDAGRGASHPRPPAFRVFAAPSRLVDPSSFNALEPGLFTVACWRMDDARFDFDSSFVRPEARREIGILLSLAEEHLGHPLSLFGHADPTGTDVYNKELSGRRARAIHALFTRRADVWEDLHTHPAGGDQWGAGQIQTMLGALPSSSGQPLTIRLFQQENGLHVDGVAGPVTRSKLFVAYMDFLCDGPHRKLAPEQFLGGGVDPGGKGDFQGCSEFNPVVVFSKVEQKRLDQPANHKERNTENSPNRRVVGFFFARGTRVSEASWPCPRVNEGAAPCRTRFWSDGEARRGPTEVRRTYEETADTFACRFYDRLAMKSPCEASVLLATFNVRLTDMEKEPIPGAPFRILRGTSVRFGHADEEGNLTVQAVVRPEKLRIEWTLPEHEGEEAFPFAREFFVDVGTDASSDDRRLFNLGYTDSQSVENVKAYQRDFGHPESGKLGDIVEELRAFHDGGKRPLGGLETRGA
jgi:hypothetical protein